MIEIAKVLAAVFVVLAVVVGIFWGANGFLNFFASFVSFSVVATASFLGYKRVVSNAPKNTTTDEGVNTEDGEEDEEDAKQDSKFSIFLKTYKGWLFPFRLLSYALFVFVFLYFSNNSLLEITPFLIGIAVLPISAMIFTLFFRRNFA